MIWFLVAVVVIVLYNAERMPQIVEKMKAEVPHIIEVSKKASKEIKEKALEKKEEAAPKKEKAPENDK